MRLGIFGRGRLASAIAEAAGRAAPGDGHAPDPAKPIWMVGRDEEPDSPVDVAIDASHADAVEGHLEWALAAATPLVIGTTGWSIPDLEARVADRIGVVVAPNFSLAVALLRRLTAVLAGFAALDPARDPYVIEHHHTGKKDAPSGTAKMLAEAMLEGCPRKTEWVIPSGKIEPHQLGLSVIRAGTAPGTHVVGIDAPAETLEICHVARSRATFAEGALAAARWVRGRTGVHRFDAVAAHLLDPLFSGSNVR